jgi:transporter family-2 protein
MTRSDIALSVLALGAGAALPLQALINGRLGASLGSPLWASMLQNLVGASAMAVVVLISREPAPAVARIAAAPAWSWAGGLLGAFFVFSALMATPRLGATRAITVVIVGQLVASVLLDQFGVLHARRAASWETVVGVILLTAGAIFVLRRQ